MSARTNEDVSIVSQTMPTGLEGVRAIEKFLKDSTSEVKKLLYDECDVLLECRFCRNIFRSVINYVAHKRIYCKVSHVQVTNANSAATTSQDSSADFLGRQPLPATKKKGNIMNSLNKRLETEVVPISKSPELLTLHTLPRICKELPITTFEDGKQKIVGSLPANLACKEALRPDRTMLAMPQDNSSRYREMQLRSRREHSSNAAPPAREISAVEGTMVDRYERYLRQTADFAECKCLQSSCSNLKPFGNVTALAYHATVHHICNEYFKVEQAKTDEERETLAITLPCIVCGRPMRSVSGVDEHMRRYHTNVREEHRKYREEEAAEERKKKKPFSGKRDEDSRSMSPVRCEETEIKKELDEEGEEEQTKQKPLFQPRRGRRPAFRPVNEAGLEEEEDEEEEEEEREKSDEREKEEETGGGGGGGAKRKGVRAMLEARKAKKRSRGADGRAEPSGDGRAEPNERTSSGGSSNSSDDKEGEANKESHEKSEDSLLTSPPLLGRHGSGATSSSNNSTLKSPSPRKGESKRYEESVDDDLIVGLCVDYLVKEACRMAGEVEKRRPGRPPKKRPLESFMEATSKLAQEESSRSLPRPGRGRGAKRHISHRHSMPASGSSTAVPAKRERRSGEKEKEMERRSKEHEEHREQKEEEEAQQEEKREQLEEKGGGDSEDETMSEKGGVSRPARVRRRPGWMESYEMKSAGNEMDTSMDSKQDILTRALESALGSSPPPRIAASNDDFVLPPPQSDSAPSSQSPSPKKKRPVGWKSRNEDSSQRSKNLLRTPKKKGKGYPSDEDSVISDFLYTPVAGRLLKEKRKGAEVEDGDCSRDNSEDDPSTSSRRRKQNLGQVADDSDDFQIVQVGDGRNIQRRSDLASVPVYLSETQQRLFFTGLKTVPAQKTGSGKETFECSYCHTKMANIRDGRRHMVSHLRVMRLRCALCSAGSFFCIDMRNHLQQRGCPNLHLAPKHLVAPGTVTPCMSKQDADNLTYIAHPMSPGRTLFTSGKIVSITSHKPYLPDPVIEEQMLGPARVPPRLLSSPRKVPLKLIKSTAAAANAALFQDHRQQGGVQNLEKVLVNYGDDESPTYYEDVDDAALSVVSSADQGGGPSEGAAHSSTPSTAGAAARSTLASAHRAAATAAHAEDTAESGARRTAASTTGSSASSAMLHASDAVQSRTAAPTGKSKSYTKRASTVEEKARKGNGTATAKPPMLVAKAASAGREAGPATTTKRASSQGDERGARLSQSASSSGQQQQQQMQHIRLMTATGDINVSRSRPTPTPTPLPAEPSPQPPTSGTPMVM